MSKIQELQAFLAKFDHQSVRCHWLCMASKIGQNQLNDKVQMNNCLSFGWAETVTMQSKLYTGKPMEKTQDGGMTYPRISNTVHKHGYYFLDMILPLLKFAFDLIDIVIPGTTDTLKRYIGCLPFPHDPVVKGDQLKPKNPDFNHVCSMFH